jgi:hypothetical protein
VIILSATAVDAAVNHTIERLFRPAELTRVHAPVLWLARQHVAKAKPIRKRLDLLALARGTSINWNIDPWLSLPELFHLRNSLVHFNAEAVVTSDGGPVFRDQRLVGLAKRLGLWPIFEAGGTWLDVFLNKEGACWTFGAANDCLDALDAGPWKGDATQHALGAAGRSRDQDPELGGAGADQRK